MDSIDTIDNFAMRGGQVRLRRDAVHVGYALVQGSFSIDLSCVETIGGRIVVASVGRQSATCRAVVGVRERHMFGKAVMRHTMAETHNGAE